jgi:sterol desaturase/sphingolipid hydroxylase (fatty acid hydroxylase superfamily)
MKIVKMKKSTLLYTLLAIYICTGVLILAFQGMEDLSIHSLKIFVEDTCSLCYNVAARDFTKYIKGQFVSYYFYIFIAGIFIVELLIPVRKGQKIFSVGFWQDFLWFLTTIFFFSFFYGLYAVFLDKTFANYLVFLKVDVVSRWPVVIQIISVILVGDFLGWLHHYIRHKVPVFWHFHKIHHSQRELNLFTDYRAHFMEYFIANTIRFIPFLSLVNYAFVPTSIVWILFNRWHTRIYHSNLKTNYGPLRYILVNPQSHRIHHSREPKHFDKNFGVLFSFWDFILGTQYKHYDEYPETGIIDDDFPHETELKLKSLIITYIQQLLYPFKVIKNGFVKQITGKSTDD